MKEFENKVCNWSDRLINILIFLIDKVIRLQDYYPS